jgi:hypothetical protein
VPRRHTCPYGAGNIFHVISSPPFSTRLYPTCATAPTLRQDMPRSALRQLVRLYMVWGSGAASAEVSHGSTYTPVREGTTRRCARLGNGWGWVGGQRRKYPKPHTFKA